MNKKFVALTLASVGTILVSISAQAGALAIDAAVNLFLSDGHSIFKYAPDGTKSTFAVGLNQPTFCADDAASHVYVNELATPANSTKPNLTPNAKRSKDTMASMP